MFASAGRCDGLLAFASPRRQPLFPALITASKAHDIVDVCPLNDPCYPHAVACLSRNRVIFLFRDALENQEPVSLNYEELQGTAYTLLSAQGHLFLLTDRELVTLPDVACRFLRGESLAGPLKIGCVPVNVSEASLWRDQAILLIEEDSSVAYLVIEDLIGATESTHQQAEVELNGQPHQESTSGPIGEVQPIENIDGDVKIVENVPIQSGRHAVDRFDMPVKKDAA